jgi:chemotaxis protein MotB
MPKIAASFLEEDSNGWLMTFSDLVLQLFAFVMVAAVLGTGAASRPASPSHREPRRNRPWAAALTSEQVDRQAADALSRARFDEPAPALPVQAATIPSREEASVTGAAIEDSPAAIAPEAVAVARPIPERSLAGELEAFVTTQGLSDVVRVSVAGGGVNLSISDTIGFASGSADLLPDASSVLAEVRQLVTARPELIVEVSGHSDDRPLHAGVFHSNLDLSLARAARVAHELAADDAELTGRIFAAGYGAARPVASNDDAEGRARNRRVELRLVQR